MKCPIYLNDMQPVALTLAKQSAPEIQWIFENILPSQLISKKETFSIQKGRWYFTCSEPLNRFQIYVLIPDLLGYNMKENLVQKNCFWNWKLKLHLLSKMFILFDVLSSWVELTIGGSKGGRQGRAPPPPGGPNSFIFMQFSAKMWKIIAILGVGAPPGENPGSATAYSL